MQVQRGVGVVDSPNMPINSGPGIGGKPGGSKSFAPPSLSSSPAPTKWVVADGGGGGSSGGGGGAGGGGGGRASGGVVRGPVNGSVMDILSDPWAWLCALGASAAVAVLGYQAGEESTATSKWIYIAASFAGYLCAIFVAGFAVAAFLWVGTKSKVVMQVGFTFVAIVIAMAPLALNKIRMPKQSEAAPAPAAQTTPEPVQQQPAVQEPVAQAPAPVVEQPAQPVVEPTPEPTTVIPRRPVQPTGPMLRSELRIEPVRPKTVPRPAGKPAQKPVHPDVKVVQAELRVLRAALRKDNADLRENLEAEGMKSILAPTSFATRERIKDSRRRLANLRRIVDEYERNVVARLDEFPARLRELDVVDGVKEATTTAFEKERADALKRYKEVARLDRAILAEADRLFVFMESRVGRFRVTDRLMFRDAADAETYTVYVERLQELGSQEEQAVAGNEKAVLGKLLSIERELATLDPG